MARNPITAPDAARSTDSEIFDTAGLDTGVASPCHALSAICSWRAGDLSVLRNEVWLRHLALTSENAVNLERVRSLSELRGNYVVDYVERTLRLLASLCTDGAGDRTDHLLGARAQRLLEETLKWSETAKCGMPWQRTKWMKSGMNLAVHNVGAAQIWLSSTGPEWCSRDDIRIVHDLILTHGLIGQQLRGEVPIHRLRPLFDLVTEQLLPADELRVMLRVLHACIVGAVDERLRKETAWEAADLIDHVLDGTAFLPPADPRAALKDKLRRLRANSIRLGEDFHGEFERVLNGSVPAAGVDPFAHYYPLAQHDPLGQHEPLALHDPLVQHNPLAQHDPLMQPAPIRQPDLLPNMESHMPSAPFLRPDAISLPDRLSAFLDGVDLWYAEAALYDFSFEEFIKVLLICLREASGVASGGASRTASGDASGAPSSEASSEASGAASGDASGAPSSVASSDASGAASGEASREASGAVCDRRALHHLSFERLMRDIYYEHDGSKKINLYKKRILEKHLAACSIADILAGRFPENPHVAHALESAGSDTVFFTFRWSPAGSRLIDFCVEAEKSDVLYERAILMLFDLFGLRRDAYDRFNNEESYLATMNRSIDEKKVILDHIAGSRVIDIGPGGGALMDLIEVERPEIEVTGLDISQNVLDALRRKKQLEGRRWNVAFGDALDLGATVPKGSADTIIFCSVLHELYSYIPFEGRKFNHATLAKAFRSAFDILPPGGRIIIRDGIMTEPADQQRIIRFLSEDGLAFLKRYAADFEGREIRFEPSGRNEVRMAVNDAMEFLYTYTWGEKSYVHEVQEQFGYFTPSGYEAFIRETLGEQAEILVSRHYLQQGYSIALAPKVAFMDAEGRPVRLPDSTCLIVIRKRG